MMTLKANQQKMYYSLQDEPIPIYETDSDGNIIYYADDKLDTGEVELVYSKPIEFKANITNKLNEATWKDFGIDESTNYAQIVESKGILPLKVGSVIWKQTEIGYKDNVRVDETTADYIVMGVADEGLNEDLFLLRKNVK